MKRLSSFETADKKLGWLLESPDILVHDRLACDSSLIPHKGAIELTSLIIFCTNPNSHMDHPDRQIQADNYRKLHAILDDKEALEYLNLSVTSLTDNIKDPTQRQIFQLYYNIGVDNPEAYCNLDAIAPLIPTKRRRGEGKIGSTKERVKYLLNRATSDFIHQTRDSKLYGF